VNQFGTVYIADTANNRIRRVDPSTGIITTYAGKGTAGNTGDGGLATDATINTSNRVIAYNDVDGHILISDTDNNRVREVTNAY
jgi:sugar lactone lactonase YvrE